MKRLFALLFVFMLISSTCLADNSRSLKDYIAKSEKQTEQSALTEDEIILKAIDVLTDYWKDDYSQAFYDEEDGYLDIKWTRAIYINQDLPDNAKSIFDQMNCYVEFFLLSNYFGTAPCYLHAGINECVAYMNDGSFKLTSYNPINTYRSRTYETDFTPIIMSISDREAEFNRVFDLRN